MRSSASLLHSWPPSERCGRDAGGATLLEKSSLTYSCLAHSKSRRRQIERFVDLSFHGFQRTFTFFTRYNCKVDRREIVQRFFGLKVCESRLRILLSLVQDYILYLSFSLLKINAKKAVYIFYKIVYIAYSLHRSVYF